jgi:cytochrome c oxidase assembly protein Cox11
MQAPFSPGVILAIVCQYAAEVSIGDSLKKSETLSADVIMGSVNAVVTWMCSNTYNEVPLYTNECGSRQV